MSSSSEEDQEEDEECDEILGTPGHRGQADGQSPRPPSASASPSPRHPLAIPSPPVGSAGEVAAAKAPPGSVNLEDSADLASIEKDVDGRVSPFKSPGGGGGGGGGGDASPGRLTSGAVGADGEAAAVAGGKAATFRNRRGSTEVGFGQGGGGLAVSNITLPNFDRIKPPSADGTGARRQTRAVPFSTRAAPSRYSEPYALRCRPGSAANTPRSGRATPRHAKILMDMANLNQFRKQENRAKLVTDHKLDMKYYQWDEDGNSEKKIVSSSQLG